MAMMQLKIPAISETVVRRLFEDSAEGRDAGGLVRGPGVFRPMRRITRKTMIPENSATTEFFKVGEAKTS
jgi:hypothetical protein